METKPGEGTRVHHPPAVHARDQPRAGGAHRRGVLRAAAADGRGRAAPVQVRSHRAPRARCGRASITAARSTASSTWRTSSAWSPRQLPGQDVTIPVVLVRAGEHSTGLVADELDRQPRDRGQVRSVRRSRASAASPAPPSSATAASSSSSTSVRWCAPSGARARRRPRRRASVATGAPSPWWSMTRSPCGA